MARRSRLQRTVGLQRAKEPPDGLPYRQFQPADRDRPFSHRDRMLEDRAIWPVPTRVSGPISYLICMPKRQFEPCLPARQTQVPTGADWIHEIKHDGYVPIVMIAAIVAVDLIARGELLYQYERRRRYAFRFVSAPRGASGPNATVFWRISSTDASWRARRILRASNRARWTFLSAELSSKKISTSQLGHCRE